MSRFKSFRRACLSVALLWVALLPATWAAEKKLILTNEEREEYARNVLIANNRHIIGGWHPVAEPNTTNRFYPVNPAPLQQTAYVKLPLGAVRPAGWLLRQMKLQVDGMTGNYYENFKVGGSVELFNYFEGFIPLAFQLDDEELKARAKKYVFREMSQQLRDPLHFTSNSDGESAYQSLRALCEYYEATNDPQVLALIGGFYDALKGQVMTDTRAVKSWERYRSGEYMQVALWLYQRTGRKDLLETIEANWAWPIKNVFSFYWLTGPYWPMGSEQDYMPVFPGKFPQTGGWSLHHAVNVAMEIKYPGLYYQLHPELVYANATFGGLERLDSVYGLTAGRYTGHEHFEPGPQQGHSPANGLELCAITEMMNSMQKLFAVYGDGRLADRIELLIFNAYAGQITADYWSHQYDGESNQIAVRLAKHQHGNDCAANTYGFMPNCACCLNNMHTGWPKFTENMWMATHDQGLIAVVYGPCRVASRVGDGTTVTLTEETDYPFDGAITMKLDMPHPVAFPLQLRIPAWAEGAEVEVGGQTLKPEAGSICRIEREWHSGDAVRIHFPMRLRTETRYNNSVSVLRGPVYYSLRVGMNRKQLPAWSKDAAHGIALGYPAYDWEIEAATPWNYGLILDRADPEHDLQVVRNPVGALPFAQKGEHVFLKRGERKYEQVVTTEDAPVVIKAKARRLPQWGMDKMKTENVFVDKRLLALLPDWKNTAADPAAPPVSPAVSSEPVEDVELIPYGCARLRVTELPTLKQ